MERSRERAFQAQEMIGGRNIKVCVSKELQRRSVR